MSAILRFPDFKYKAFSLNYDDGAPEDERLVGIFKEHDLCATFNLMSSSIGEGRFLNPTSVKELYLDNGMEIAVHGDRHCSLAAVDSAVATRDVIRCREELERLTGRIIKGMAYANGSYNEDVKTMLRLSGIEYCRTSRSSESFDLPTDMLALEATCHHNNPRLGELADSFLDAPMPGYYWSRRPRLFIVWGHSFEFRKHNNWELIESFAERISGRDDVWYATCGDIMSYILDFRRLRFSADGSLIHNPTARTLYCYDFGRNIAIAPGETVRSEG